MCNFEKKKKKPSNAHGYDIFFKDLILKKKRFGKNNLVRVNMVCFFHI